MRGVCGAWDLFVEGIGGQRSGTHKIKDEVSFVAVAVRVSPNGRIVTENGDAVREWIEVNVDETGAKEGDCGVNVDVWDVDVDGKGSCYAIGDCSEEFVLHEVTIGEVR